MKRKQHAVSFVNIRVQFFLFLFLITLYIIDGIKFLRLFHIFMNSLVLIVGAISSGFFYDFIFNLDVFNHAFLELELILRKY